MLKRFSILVLAVVCSALLPAQSAIHLTVHNTRANDGKQMFVSYCAPCHGVEGRGNGPVAAALKVPPADLSVLARNNHGVYPAVHLMAVVKFGVENPAHGSAEMPVWGTVLNQMDHTDYDARALRIANLVHYVQTLQAK